MVAIVKQQSTCLALVQVMIRWYDYIAAFVFADVIMTLVFSIPMFGFVAAYLFYEYGWIGYCELRKDME